MAPDVAGGGDMLLRQDRSDTAHDRRAPLTHARQPMTPQVSPADPGTSSAGVLGGMDAPEAPRPMGPTGSMDPTAPMDPTTATGPAGADRTGPSRNRPWRTYLRAGAGYLVVSLVLWAHVLAHPATVTTCGCGDGALTLWVIKWPAYALSHGLNPFYSAKLFVPKGINMAPNSLGLGLAAAPVTWLFGPVASLNVIDVVSPAVSALAMFWLLRRWVTWAPSALVGGLLFGFSPFVVVSLALAHPNFGLLAPVPLIIGCLDDLFVRHRFRPLRVGVVLGLLVVVEFFVSVEVLSLVSLFAVLAALALGGWALARRDRAVGRTVLAAVPAVAAAAGVALVLLAYPLWFFFAGPAHLTGRAWPDSPAGTVANTWGAFLNGFISAPLTGIMHLFGGYQGPALPLLGYLGGGLIVVVVVGAVVWHRDPVLRGFALVGLVAVVLSLGVVPGSWSPWRLFVHLPVLNNVVPVNISVIVDTCAAIVLALVVDNVHRAVGRRSRAWRGPVAGGVAAVALVPIVVALWPNIPMTVRAVRSPVWFTRTAPHLSGDQVVLPYPAALGGIQSSMAWQTRAGLTFSMVGGGGPGITPSRAGPETPGFMVLSRASVSLGPAPAPTAANLDAIRAALAGWGVTTVVVPDQPGLPSYDRGRTVPYAVGLFTAALGRPPVRQSSAWIWTSVATSVGASVGASAAPPVSITPAAFSACVQAPGASGATAATCVLGAR